MQKRSLIGLAATLTIAATATATASALPASGSAATGCDGTIDEGTLSMFAHEGSEADAYTAAIEAFNAGPGADIGVSVDLTLIPEGQYTDQINSAAAAGDLPAVLDFDGPNMANLAWVGSLVSLESCVTDEVRNNLLPSIVEQGTYNGELYGLGSFDSGLGLYAWASALEEVGARIPAGADDAWTADELEQILRDLQEAGYEHPLDTKFWYGVQGEWSTYAFAPIVWSAGGDLIDRETGATADGALNTPEVAAALTQFQTWVTDGLIDADAADDSNFLEQRSPISWVGHWMYVPYKEAAGDDLVVLPLPDFGNGTRTGMGSWAWGMTSNAGDPDAAWAVIEFLMSDETILAITDVNGAIPGTRSAVEQSPLHQPGGDLELFVEQLDGAPDVAVPRPVTPAYPTITSVFRTLIDNIIQGADVQVELDAAVDEIDADIEANEGYPAPG
ncbi:sugar ABC transporter substrate-binding protein [Desertimonas flava]|jgi:multiple sugar transport system substrate-binding protein|uniref:sugar ABC transporter substrate-binding protein n=1 Tax=Desertimonas flava TaxID=2064846 RepID=UPI000E34AAB7|nr:sugar ABC transporter substrate-binding protein [Desertimonas flava]